MSQAFRYGAMGVTPVSMVTALQRLSSIFPIYSGWTMNNRLARLARLTWP